MHILYLDESGTHKGAHHFVVAGLAVFERDTYFLARSLDQLAAQYLPTASEPVVFHASSLRAPEDKIPKPFSDLLRHERMALLQGVYRLIADSHATIFAAAIEKDAIGSDNPYEVGFEQMVSRFDHG